ncbi:M20/M25/M40 family metallo-hydrolase [Bryobacter aggregatus]|uniref:M20/M25/M40 family metallo-hydrolase n=1 Tax=Bryobacter aggregatus TaxID=360054 RepID=UPI0004E1345F|nr:M20/M25/M40 family metallo-hydrolase [Bryobacter aggregatus]
MLDPIALTRRLVDIESITGNEMGVSIEIEKILTDLAKRFNGTVERIPVEPERDNLFCYFGESLVTLSTHMDTVPPFFPSREDEEFIWGRGACDVKGIIAAMICAGEKLLEAGGRNFGFLFVVGEERNSVGAYHAGRNPRGSKFIVNGEPTENRLALGSKGALRLELTATGKMAHSAYPELGESAIEKLLDALERIRKIDLPWDDVLGPSTLNIGVLSGGRAPNVIPDAARAELLIRLVDNGDAIVTAIRGACTNLCEVNEVLRIPAVRLGAIDGFDTMVASYTTDIPAFQGAWGQPYLLGPGTIHVAHTSEERIPKRQLLDAVEIYQQMLRTLLERCHPVLK